MKKISILSEAFKLGQSIHDQTENKKQSFLESKKSPILYINGRGIAVGDSLGKYIQALPTLDTLLWVWTLGKRGVKWIQCTDMSLVVISLTWTVFQSSGAIHGTACSIYSINGSKPYLSIFFTFIYYCVRLQLRSIIPFGDDCLFIKMFILSALFLPIKYQVFQRKKIKQLKTMKLAKIIFTIQFFFLASCR